MNTLVVVTEALAEVDRIARLDLVTRVYMEQRYITDRDLDAHGRFVDVYESVAISFVAWVCGVAVGSIRIIPEDCGVGLPVKTGFSLAPGISAPPGVELSQLAVLDGHRKDQRVMLALIKRVADYCRARSIDSWYVAIDRRLLWRMRQMGFVFAPLGESKLYLGSLTIPAFLSLKAGLEFLRTTNPELHAFFESPRGAFPWYTDGAEDP